ncbi:MAG: hypothetical protein KAS67_01260 [Thermoplasmata archaeon]|nr:hypothetical protein [Thermoplasmata archaeon]
METIFWILIISVIVFIFLGAWGLKFPRAGKDWGKDRQETMSMVFSMSIFLMFFLLLWYVIGIVDWPPAMDLIIWGSAITFFLLILAAIFLPKGTKLNLKSKKDKNIKTADDDD